MLKNTTWKDSRMALARLSGSQQRNRGCRSCHFGAPIELAQFSGVQCESYHGNGEHYSPTNVMRDKKLAKLMGLKRLNPRLARNAITTQHRASLSLTLKRKRSYKARVDRSAPKQQKSEADKQSLMQRLRGLELGNLHWFIGCLRSGSTRGDRATRPRSARYRSFSPAAALHSAQNGELPRFIVRLGSRAGVLFVANVFAMLFDTFLTHRNRSKTPIETNFLPIS